MRYKRIFLGILFLSLLFCNVTIKPVLSYEFGHQPSNDLIWRCNICKTEELYSIFGMNWSSNGFFEHIDQGKKMRWEILSLEKEGGRLNLTVNTWKWQDENTWANSTDQDSYWYYSNPSEYPNNYNLSKNFPFIKLWLPLPMSEYMSNLNLSQIYDIDDRVLFTIFIHVDKDYISNNDPSQAINIIAIFNENGFLDTFKIYLQENVVLLSISLEYIPIYAIPIVIFIFGFLISAILLYFFYLKPREKR
jgi:hypothetical protein